MYKVLIVEDEVPVRDTIIESVDWSSIGLEVVYAAGDGQEALDYFMENQVELVLTDIYMPFIDGMELARRIRENNKYCKILFLTGYNEFDYAKEAIELNASRYLLKPITKDELTKVLCEMKEALDQEIEASKNLSKLEAEYGRSLTFLKDKLLYDIIAGFIPRDRINQACESLNCDLSANYYRVGIIEVKNKEEVGQHVWSEDYSLLQFAMFNITKGILSARTITHILLGDQGKIIIIFTSDDGSDFPQYPFDALNEILHTIRHIYKMNISAGLSSNYEALCELQYAYQEALSAIDYSVIEGSNRVIVTADIERATPMNHRKLDETMSEVVSGLKVNNMDRSKQHLTLFMDQIKFNHYGLNEVKTLILSLVTKIYDGYNQMCLEEEMKKTLDFRLVENLFEMEEFSAVEEQIKTTLYQLSDELKRSRQDDKTRLIHEAILYIEATYMNPTLDLKEMSEYLHVSASYFSRLFKQSRHQTFLEYLTEYRMDRAKELLKSTDYKVYEIATQVGYDDPHYFSYNFRKNIGTTPLKFRKA